jgi:hypothetical protein
MKYFSKEDIEYLSSLTDEDVEKLKKGGQYPSFFCTETNNALEAIEVITCVQVLKYIIDHYPNPDIYSVLKILYLANKINLLKYNNPITSDTYLKLKIGPVPKLSLHIIQFVRGEEYFYEYDESIKNELEVIKDPKNGKLNRLHSLTKPDLTYLSELNIKCLDEAITKYVNSDPNELRELTYDEIYHSTPNLNDEITIIDMAKNFKNLPF